MCEDNWTGREEERQDCVDNAIYNLLLDLGRGDEDSLEWDIEDIANVREVLQGIIVDKLKLMTEQEFYPYRELKAIPNPEPPEPQPEMIVTDEQLVTAVHKVIEEMDADELAQLAGDALGGLCWYLNDNTYSFIPDENYYGGLDFTKEEKHG